MRRIVVTVSGLALVGLVGFAQSPAREGRPALASLRPTPPPPGPRSDQARGVEHAKDEPAGKGERTGYGYAYGGPGYDRSKSPDSFKYYGPNGLWSRWDEGQRLGRDTWFFDTGGNQKFYRILARFGAQLGISVDFFRLLDSKRRGDRFREIGLINEPNFEPAGDDETDDYGFRRDKWKGDPVAGAYPEDARWYGQPTGIVGLRIFPNPDFTDAMRTEWLKDKKASIRKYFADPGKVEPPYVVGITCALCHVAFDPLNPPADPASPRWENLAANIGNQYFREGDLFFGAGRVVGGDANPDPSRPDDPYATRGLDESNFLYQYGHTQQPGTSETSRFSYDFINNPNTINQIAFIGNRAKFAETTSTGVATITNHILKDGADSIGIHGALLRVFINIGSEGDYWADHLWNPATGTTQRPFSLKEVRLAAGLAPPSGEADRARKDRLLRDYPELGQAWREQERRVPFLASYLASYTPYELTTLKDRLKGKVDKDGQPLLSEDETVLRRGAEVFAENCAVCHSNKQPFYPMTTDDDRRRFFKGLVASDDFLPGNTLSDDVRYPFNYPNLAINPARALATNAVEGDIWADFSSRDYKALTPLRSMTFENPLHRLDRRFGDRSIVTEFDAPGGGRGYYRTAALNNLWATAPYLHNNSVGVDPVDDHGLLDPRFITVEGRLELYRIAMDQLLNPGKRPIKVKVTSADTTFTSGLPGVRRRIAGALADSARQSAEEVLALAVSEVIDGSDVPAQFKPALKEVFAVLAADLRPEIDAFLTGDGPAKVRDALVAKAREKIHEIIADKLKDKPQLAQLATPLLAKFEAAMRERTLDLAALLRAELSIPKGTPVNLFMNLHIAKIPYALKAYLKLKHDPSRLAEALLRLSDCPDLVENHGHTFGSDLPPEDKKALTEYMKTF